MINVLNIHIYMVDDVVHNNTVVIWVGGCVAYSTSVDNTCKYEN